MPDTITVYQDNAKEWRWRKVAANGETVATSEGYTRKSDAIEAAHREGGKSGNVEVEE